MEPIKIGFTGNRYGLKSEQKNQITLILDKYDDMILSHGDCVGADTEFHKYGGTPSVPPVIYNFLKIHIFPPDNLALRAFNKGDLLMVEKPYLKRNMDIIKNSSMLIACPIDKNKEVLRSGTWSTIRKAKKQNLTIHIL